MDDFDFAKRAGRLEAELERLGLIPLLTVGYIPFDPEAGALFFALISSRYERRSLVVNSEQGGARERVRPNR